MRKYLAGVFGSEINEMSCVWGSRAAWNARQKPYALHKLFNSCPGQFLGRFSSCFHVGLVDGSRGFARCGGQRKGTNFNCRLHDNDNTPPHALFGGRSSSQKSEIKTQKKKKNVRRSSESEMCEFLTSANRSRGMYNMALYTIVAPPDLWPSGPDKFPDLSDPWFIYHIQIASFGCWDGIMGLPRETLTINTKHFCGHQKKKKKCVQKSWRSTLSDGMNNCVNRLV